jgi:regulatory protein
MPRTDRKPSPLSESKLQDLALAYVARFATTRAKLEAYLVRKLRERGWDGEREPDAAALAQRFAEAGYVDDAVYARMKSDSLLRRGYGARRVGEALRAAGVDETLRQDVAPAIADARRAAFALARRRRFGPWAQVPADRPIRERQVAAMLRAGHTLDNARQIVEATDVAVLEEWVESALGGDETCE